MDPAPVGRFVVGEGSGVGDEERVVGQGDDAHGVEEEQDCGQAQQQQLLVATNVSCRLHFWEPLL